MGKLRAFASFLKQLDRSDWVFAFQIIVLAIVLIQAFQVASRMNEDIKQLKDYIHDQNTQNKRGVENLH